MKQNSSSKRSAQGRSGVAEATRRGRPRVDAQDKSSSDVSMTCFSYISAFRENLLGFRRKHQDWIGEVKIATMDKRWLGQRSMSLEICGSCIDTGNKDSALLPGPRHFASGSNLPVHEK